MPVLLIDVVSAVQEVVLQACEQIPGEVGPGFVGTAMYADLCQTFFDDRCVAGVREMDGPRCLNHVAGQQIACMSPRRWA